MKLLTRALRVLTIIVALVAVTAWAGCKGTGGANLIPFSSSSAGVKFQYPSTWQRLEGQDAAGFVAVFLLSPKNSIANLNVDVGDLPDKKMTLAQLNAAGEQEIKTGIPNSTVVNSSDATLAGLPAHKLVITAPSKSQNGTAFTVELESVWTIKDGKRYQVNFVSDKTDFDSQVKQVQVMLDSFQVQ